MAKYFKLNPKNFQYKKYYNNRTAIVQFDPIEGAIATLTVNIPDCELSDDEVIIKNYSENEGVLEDMIKHNIVSEPVRYVSTGFVKVPVCKLKKDNKYGN